MYFVQYHHFIGQSPQADKMVLDVHHAKQCLVYRAHAIRRQQAAPALGKPGGRTHRLALAVFAPDIAQARHAVVQQSPAMRQLNIQRTAISKGAQKGQGALKHGIASSLGGQSHIQAAMPLTRLQAQAGQKRQLGFAFAHGRFHHQQGRALALCQQGIRHLLQWAGAHRCIGLQNPGNQRVAILRQPIQQRLGDRPAQAFWLGQCRYGQLAGMRPMAQQGRLALAGGKPFAIGANPVADTGQTGQPGHGVQADVDFFRYALRRQRVPVRVQQGITRLSPRGWLAQGFASLAVTWHKIETMVRADGLHHGKRPWTRRPTRL